MLFQPVSCLVLRKACCVITGGGEQGADRWGQQACQQAAERIDWNVSMNFVDCLPAVPVYAVVVAAVDSLHFSAEADVYDTLLWCWTVRSNVLCSTFFHPSCRYSVILGLCSATSFWLLLSCQWKTFPPLTLSSTMWRLPFHIPVLTSGDYRCLLFSDC